MTPIRSTTATLAHTEHAHTEHAHMEHAHMEHAHPGPSLPVLLPRRYATDSIHPWTAPLRALRRKVESWHEEHTGQAVSFNVCLLNRYASTPPLRRGGSSHVRARASTLQRGHHGADITVRTSRCGHHGADITVLTLRLLTPRLLTPWCNPALLRLHMRHACAPSQV